MRRESDSLIGKASAFQVLGAKREKVRLVAPCSTTAKAQGTTANAVGAVGYFEA